MGLSASRLVLTALALLAAIPAASCSSSTPKPFSSDGGDGSCTDCASSNILHLVLIVQENHTFDSHFGAYCTAKTGSNPTCTDGPACCEAAPATDPAGVVPVVLDDDELGHHDPNHESACELAEMNQGKMDAYATAACGSTRNVAYADPALVKPYWDLAAKGAIADRYFQPIVGQSSSNDMYFARAGFVFLDNALEPQDAVGAPCGIFQGTPRGQFTDPTIADLLIARNVSFSVYAGGYQAMVDAQKKKSCPFPPPPDCPLAIGTYPCLFDPGDIPFEFYPSTRDNPKTMKDISAFAADLAAGKLPSVSYVKGIGYQTEHPGSLDRISDGVAFVTGILRAIESSPYAATTLVLVTYDEGGGYFDHVTPPPPSTADGKAYGTRVPLLAVGPFAKRGYVSHVVMEHSSIVRFIEWNWLEKKTGQLGARDTVVANLGSLLDAVAVGTAVPE